MRFPIPQIDEKYFATHDGEIFDPYGNKIIGIPNMKGYLRIKVHINGKLCYRSIHRLVAATFLGLDLKDRGIQVDHGNENKQDNSDKNLTLVTNLENANLYAGRLGVDTDQKRLCAKCKIVKPVTEFRASKKTSSGYHSYCRTCHNAINNEYGNNKLRKERINDTSSNNAGKPLPKDVRDHYGV